MKKYFWMLVALLIAISMSLSISAATEPGNCDSAIEPTVSCDDQIIGHSASVQATRASNILTVDWVASATQVIITVTNNGNDTADTFAGTVAVQRGSSKSFSAANLAPLSSRTIYVDLNMQNCYETITVSYYRLKGSSKSARGSLRGYREIPSTLSSCWHPGTFDTAHDSMNYHYKKHKLEVGSTNIVDYATKAAGYRTEVVSDIENLSTENLSNKYTVTTSKGATPSHKYKNKTDKQFALLSDVDHLVVSFGR